MPRSLIDYTIKELRYELSISSHNPVKSYLIECIIRHKIKQQHENVLKKQVQKQIENIEDVPPDEIQFNESDFVTDRSKKPEDPNDKFKEKIRKDFVNNGMMSRLNSEIGIRQYSKENKVFEPPFVEVDAVSNSGEIDNFLNTKFLK